MLSEPEIYVYAKRFLRRCGWTLVGGEPPGGTDALPRIEAKDPEFEKKGSRGSKKVDLIAYRNGRLLLLELKPAFDRSDVVKLDALVGDRKWRLAFWNACVERNALQRAGVDDDDIRDRIVSGAALTKGIGLGKYHEVPDEYVLLVVEGAQDATTHIGSECPISEAAFAEN